MQYSYPTSRSSYFRPLPFPNFSATFPLSLRCTHLVASLLALYQLPAKHDPILSPPSRSLKFSKITTVRALQASGPLPLLTPRSQLFLLLFRISTAAQFIFAVLLVGGRRAQNLVLRIRGCSAAVPAHRCAATCSGCRAFFSGMLLFLRLVFKFWFCSDPCTLYVCSEPTSRAASS